MMYHDKNSEFIYTVDLPSRPSTAQVLAARLVIAGMVVALLGLIAYWLIAETTEALVGLGVIGAIILLAAAFVWALDVISRSMR